MEDYERHLEEHGFSRRTVDSYLWVAEFFLDRYHEPTPSALGEYRKWLVQSYKPNTVNQRIQAINYWLGYLGRDDLRLETVPVVSVDLNQPSG